MTFFFYSGYPVNVTGLVSVLYGPAFMCFCCPLIAQFCLVVFRELFAGGLRFSGLFSGVVRSLSFASKVFLTFALEIKIWTD